MTAKNVYLTVYVATWDDFSVAYQKNIVDYPHKVIDIDKNHDIAVDQKIKAIPTTQIYVDGVLRATKFGAGTKKEIEEWIKECNV